MTWPAIASEPFRFFGFPEYGAIVYLGVRGGCRGQHGGQSQSSHSTDETHHELLFRRPLAYARLLPL
jgi:hypothetical protein